jgi:hypothetical protein
VGERRRPGLSSCGLLVASRDVGLYNRDRSLRKMPDQPSDADSNGNGRQADGRFGASNRFGRGNPHLRRMHVLRSSLLKSVDDDAMHEVGKRLVELAKGGDLDAIKILLSYTIGKPPQSIALTGPDGETLGVDWKAVQAAILGALASFPEARYAVAVRLKGIADDARGDRSAGDGPGSESPDESGGPAP